MPAQGEVVKGYRWMAGGVGGGQWVNSRTGSPMRQGFDPNASSSSATTQTQSGTNPSVNEGRKLYNDFAGGLNRDEQIVQTRLTLNEQRARAEAERRDTIESQIAQGNQDRAQAAADEARNNRNRAEGDLQSLIGNAPDSSAEAILRSAELLAPTPDANTQMAIDYAASLISDEGSMLRRMLDGDYDFAYFNQGVVEPLMATHEANQEELLSSFTGGDAYGRAGGTGSGAARAALAKGDRAFGETIAGLRHQEYNAMLERSLEAAGQLDEMIATMDNRPYAQAGLNAALDAAGIEGQNFATRIGAQAEIYAGNSDIFAQALDGLRTADRDRLGTQTGQANRGADASLNWADQWRQTYQGLLNLDVSMYNNAMEQDTRRWTTLLDRDFNIAEAARDQSNTDRIFASGNAAASRASGVTGGTRTSTIANSTDDWFSRVRSRKAASAAEQAALSAAGTQRP